MIVHIVMFQFKEENKERNIAMVKERLEALVDLIPELQKMEVGVNFNESERAFDLSLYSTFDSKEDLGVYAVHPEHLKVVALIKELTETSKVVDYIL
ncbi:MAG: Dabb family protein [Sulfurimonas sp.]|nr:Dabb family protein [Sulfurimonas sp.]